MLTKPHEFGADFLQEDDIKLIKLAAASLFSTAVAIFILADNAHYKKETVIYYLISMIVGCIPGSFILYLFLRKHAVTFVQTVSFIMLVFAATLLCFLPFVIALNFVGLKHTSNPLLVLPPFIGMLYVFFWVSPRVISGMTGWSFIRSISVFFFSFGIANFAMLKLSDVVNPPNYDFDSGSEDSVNESMGDD